MGRTKGAKNKIPGARALAWKRLPAAKRKEILKARIDGKRRKRLERLEAQAEVDRVEKIEKPTIEALQERIYSQLKANPLLWGHFFFPHHMRMKTPSFHLEIIRCAMSERYLAVSSPRESSKSTLLNFLYPFHGIYFKRFHFIVIVSNTFKKASMHLDSIKAELRDNAKLKNSMMQQIEITRDAEGDSEFRHADGFTTKVLCKGVDQIGSIRGVKFGAYRPDLILPDDIEDDELVRNPQRRQELQNNVDEALIPAGETGKCQFIWIGTILHDDSQLAKMVKHKGLYPEYKKLIYQAHLDPGGPNEASLWPEKWTVEWLRNLAETRPLVYAKEYQSDPAVGRAGVFVEKDFRRWELLNDEYVLYDETGQRPVGRGLLKECKAAIACDLAWEAKRQADYCVVLPGFLTPQSDLLIYRYFAKKGVRPDKLEEVIFFMADKLEALTGSKVPIGMEKAKLEKVMKWVLRQAMKRRNRFLLLVDLKWDVDKLARIETRLQPRYANHSIYHMDDMGELEAQLLRFPAAAFDDLPDAEQGLVQILQHPKHRKVEKPPMDQFEIMRRLAMGARNTPKGLYRITSKSPMHQPPGIPVRWSPLG